MTKTVTATDILNSRESEILRRLAAGLSDQQIADELVLSLNTVKWYNRQIYSKLGVNSRTQAIASAAGHSFPSGGPPVLPSLPAQYRLPVPTSLFVGRGLEMVETKRLLVASRLLTLTGAGGSGKTQLALRVAAEVGAEFADGACFVDLAPLSHHELVGKAIAEALGVLEQPEEPLLETLKRALAGRELLLLLDNFEHVIPAAPLVTQLLAAAEGLKILGTSRESLRLAGEQEYLVPPLSVPGAEGISVESLLASEAGLFFVRRAQLALPHFEPTPMAGAVIGEICRRLNGLPLAIELATVRCKLFTPPALLTQLVATGDGATLRTLSGGTRDSPLRLRTLRDSIEWSYNLLSVDEKRLFAALAVFRGGRSLEAIQSVCSGDLSINPLDGLALLVDKNLVQQKEDASGNPRFIMLETIHEYARERLRAGLRQRACVQARSGRGGTLRYLDRLLGAFTSPYGEGRYFRRCGGLESITSREHEVLVLLANGSTNQEIAARLVISVDTVKRHVSNVLSKLEASNRTQAVARARELGVLTPHTGRSPGRLSSSDGLPASSPC
jgi:predicted ATPase/DNA-binding NarL/FixJ family response regulator